MAKSEFKFKTHEIAGIAQSVCDLSDTLKTGVESGEYGLLIVEGISARMPGWVLEAGINDVYEVRGREKITAIYLEKTKEDLVGIQGLKEKIAQLPANIRKKKALLMSEIIFDGYRIGKIGPVLQAEGIGYDVAVVWASRQEEHYRRNGIIPDKSRYFVGMQCLADDFFSWGIDDTSPHTSVTHVNSLNIDIWNQLRQGHYQGRALDVRHDLTQLRQIVVANWLSSAGRV